MRTPKLILILGRNPAIAQGLKGMVWPREVEIHFADGPEFGLLNIDRLRRNIDARLPDLILSVVGSVPTGTEHNRTLTQARNHWAVGDLAEVAGGRDVPLLHLSSDQVFAGDPAATYRETGLPDAVSVFGQAQAAGEAEIRAHCRRHVILRTGWLFGASGHNMLRTMLSLGRRGGRVHVPHDHVSGPTPARELCGALRQLALTMLDTPTAEFGGHTLHFCGAPSATLFEFAQAALSRAAAFQVTPELVPISPGRFGVTGALARRTVLDCSLATTAFGLVQPDWQIALADCVDEICQTENMATEDQIAALAAHHVPYRGMTAESQQRGAVPFGVTKDRRRAD